MQTGEIKGSSPWTLTTICSSGHSKRRASSAIRSVPLACSVDVISTRAPNARHAAAIRSSSVATMTSPAPLCAVCRYTHSIIGLPAMSFSGLPGNRDDA
jgi:hypothetical protein